MKRILTFFLILILLLLPLPVHAEALPVLDGAEVLTPEQEQQLKDLAAHFPEELGCHLYFVTLPSLEGHPIELVAQDACGATGYFQRDHVMVFLVALEEREWYIATSGIAAQLFSDRSLDALGEAAVPFFSQGDYGGGFQAFFDALPDVLAQEEDRLSPKTMWDVLPLSLLLGLLAAGGTVAVMAFGMNTRRPKHSAGDYLTQGSFHMGLCQDLYLYSNVTKTRRQTGSGSSGGGGHSRGGRGGKF